MTPPPGPAWRGVARLLIVGVCVACKQAPAEEGGVLIEWLDVTEGAYGLRGTVTVRARPEAIWGVLIDYGRFPEIYPDVARTEVKESGPGGATVVMHVENFWTQYAYETRRDYVDPGRRITWRQVKGPYRSLSGEWAIRDGPGAGEQRIVCTTVVELDSPVRAVVARQFAAGRMRSTLLRLRDRLEASGQ